MFQMSEEEHTAARAQQNANLTAALAQPADLLVLDEAGSAWELDMVDKELLRRAVLQRPAGQECVLTAHTPPQWMQDAADYVTEMHCLGIPSRRALPPARGSNIKAEDHMVRITVRMLCQLLLRIGVRS